MDLGEAMKIQDQTFTNCEGAIKLRLKDTLIVLLETIATDAPMDEKRKQVALAESFRECNGELTMTPEDAVLCRSLIERCNIAPVVAVQMYDALDSEKAPDD